MPTTDWSFSLRVAAPSPPYNPSIGESYNDYLNRTIIGLPFVEGRPGGYCAYGAGKLIRIAGGDENRVNMYYSNDHGATWRSEYKNISSGGLAGADWNTYYLEDRFYAVSLEVVNHNYMHQAIWSTDGTNWQSAAIDSDGKTAWIFGYWLEDRRYLGTEAKSEIVAGNGYWLTFSITNTLGISQDKGVTWSTSWELFEKNIKHIAFGAGVFIIVCDNEIYQSTNGTNWQLKFNLNDTAAYFSNVEYGGGRFIATVSFTDARNTAFYYSVDNGSSWSLLSSLSNKIDIMAIKYGAGNWVALMNWQSTSGLSFPYSEGAAIISTNGGLTWSLSSMPYNYRYWTAGYPGGEAYWYNLVYMETATVKRFFVGGEVVSVGPATWGGGYKDVTVIPTPTPTATPTVTPTLPYSVTNFPPLTAGDTLLGSSTGRSASVFYTSHQQSNIAYPYPTPTQIQSGTTISVDVYGLPSGVSVTWTTPINALLTSNYPIVGVTGGILSNGTHSFLIVYRNRYDNVNYTTYIKANLMVA